MASLPLTGPQPRQSSADASRSGNGRPPGQRPTSWPPAIFQPLGEARAADIVEWLDPSISLAIRHAEATLRRLIPDGQPRVSRASINRIAMSRLDGLSGVVPVASVAVDHADDVAILTIGVQRSGKLAIRQTRPQVRGSRWHTLELPSSDESRDHAIAHA